MEDTNLFLRRYQNHIQIPGFGVPGQEALSSAKVLVFGAGGLSSPLLTYLSAMGCGTIGIVAGGEIEHSDLPSQPLFFSSQETKPRGAAAARQLRDINPQVSVNVYEKGIDGNTVSSLISGSDVIVNTSETMEQCLLINDACIIHKKPLVWGRVSHPAGYFAVLNYKDGATFRCLLANDSASKILSERGNKGLAILSGITGSFMANEVIKIVAGIGDVAANKLQIINHMNNTVNSVKIEPITANQQISSLSSGYGAEEQQQEQQPIPRSIRPGLLALKIKYKEALQLVDLREFSVEGEHAEVRNLLHIPASQLLQRHQEIHQDIQTVLISEDGAEAKQLCSLLNDKYGFDNIYYLDGGFKEWAKEMQSSEINYESF